MGCLKAHFFYNNQVYIHITNNINDFVCSAPRGYQKIIYIVCYARVAAGLGLGGRSSSPLVLSDSVIFCAGSFPT